MNTFDKRLILEKVRKLLSYYNEGKIKTLAQHEVHPDVEKSSTENYLYFTLAPSINFQRSSPALWLSALKTYQDPETNYLFFPEEVVKQPREKIQNDLVKHRLALQKNKHTDIWIAISQTLHTFFDDNPKNILISGNYDVSQILKLIQQDKRKYFPYLSGPKMANYWLYILCKYTETQLRNMHEISIIPDTHVIQSTIKLGISEKVISPLLVADLWKELLQGTDISPIVMHPVLWNWSRNNFIPEV